MGSLKLFVKTVRKAKTIADERTVVRKESAAIRTSFRDPNLDQTTRRVSISKLLYLYILGEKTHFGQVECLKLLASPRFADKRLGYLASMLLLDENQEVLTLLTNSLDNDMQHPNTFIVGLALSCLGNVASPELARDLYGNVDKILATSNSVYLKKKACNVAAKLTEKDPDLSDVFMPRLSTLVNDKTPLILLGSCKMIQSIYANSPESRPALVKMIPKLISHLKRIVTSGYMPDYDVTGITDPFLQAALLVTLRMLAVDESCSSQHLEDVNDILTQVALNLDGGKNASHAILYECVKTVFAIKSDQSLRVLGVNILGKFLLIKDNNTRYVALEMLLTVIEYEPLAVQRHRATIVSCLSDGDISIRRRALELSFAIMNEQNVRVLLREILAFLDACPENDLKPFITSQLSVAAAKYAPTGKWHFDTLIRMLKVSGNFVTPDIISSILAFVMRCDDAALRKHVVSKLILSSFEDGSQYGLAMVAIWCVGEYADLVLNTQVEINGKAELISEKKILNMIDSYVNNTSYSELETVQLVSTVLTAVIKLSVKFKDAESIEQLRLILNAKSWDNDLEIQTRAIEYQQIFGQDEKLKQGLMSRMPAPPMKEQTAHTLQGKSKPASSPHLGPFNSSSATEDLLDLLDDSEVKTPGNTNLGTNNDLLQDIFGSLAKKSLDARETPAGANSDLLNGLLSSSNASANAASTLKKGDEVFENGHLRILFTPGEFGEGRANVDVEITSLSHSDQIEKVQLLIAVPKSQKLTIATTAGTDSLVTSSTIRQALKVAGAPGSKMKLRVKVKYQLNGESRDDQFDYAGFTETL
ncbi:clathrin associated protein complex large subunit, gamma-adaptin [Metschnikowia bicuspidata var. bicuspidata NRRL YB-4993]|uniref:AP-1 complex subunit gamma n=1 Tax=Metschnikowia bicuspidata var. bicuspidata NRRL YB-4993 TaxID=869754 RepID=A0A1A0H7L3_9ASCO|nr:clathrin associated protein complex large subunit, gamma-adaptin [Metschnikowia bicuspidata var. bicuspidata NRRL YB-4993]OBA19970.1 clathrin associated protein complex large subunit, gamma-adaptin [Metschnikowia bicuspidata var. bicuspidata NRRL YB-4993]